MKRVLIIGGISVAVIAVLVAVLVAGVAIGVLATPVRAQIGQTIGQVLSGQNVLSAQAQAQVPQLKLKDEKGVLVAGVFQDSPADKAGIQRGDIVLQVDGKDVNTVADLNGVLTAHKAGDSIQLQLQRGDSQKTVSATLADQPAAAQPAQNGTQSATPAAPNSNQPGQKQNRGFHFFQGTDGTGPYLGIIPLGAGEFGMKAGRMGGFDHDFAGQVVNGAPIVEVAQGGPAEKAGLKAGEVIVSLDGKQIDAQNSLQSLLAAHKPGDTVKLTVTGTDGKQRDVSVTLGDNPNKQGSAYLGVSIGGRGMRGGMNGQNGQGLNPNLFQHPGALVGEVVQGSPAEKAGLKAGQLIEAVDGTKLQGPQALAQAVSSHKPGDAITLSVFDPTTSQTSDVKVTLGDNPQKAGSAWLGVSFQYIDMQQMPQQLPTPQAGNRQG